MEKMRGICETVKAVFSEDELVEKVISFVYDKSFSKGECVDLLKDLFGENTPLIYDTIAERIMSLDETKKPVELF